MLNTDAILAAPPHDFVALLEREGVRRFHFVYDVQTQSMRSSHALLQPIADWIETEGRDFRGHEGLFFQVSREHETLQGAFVHRTCRGQAAGGVRYWGYDSLEDYLRDGLRLAVGMTLKNALAGLWWGGGKGVMASSPGVAIRDPEVRRALYREYGELLTATRGCYVGAEDVGTSVEDMRQVFSATRFTTCIPEALGGSGNPSVPTARGVVCAMQAALTYLGLEGLAGKTAAVQGLGHVGEPLVRFLFEAGVARVLACDVDPAAVERCRGVFADLAFDAKLVPRDDLSFLETECDVLAPCATGAVFAPATIARLRARLICGAANNQLEDLQRDDALLFDRGVTYVPDFVANRMGIVTCANEGYGYVTADPEIEKHLGRAWEHSIYNVTQEVLRESAESRTPPGQVALRRAEALSLEPHPLFGHRGQRIITSLARDEWHAR